MSAEPCKVMQVTSVQLVKIREASTACDQWTPSGYSFDHVTWARKVGNILGRRLEPGEYVFEVRDRMICYFKEKP